MRKTGKQETTGGKGKRKQKQEEEREAIRHNRRRWYKRQQEAKGDKRSI